LSTVDPFDQLALGPGDPRRRDLREKSTGRSRRAARKKAVARRKMRMALKASTGRRPQNSRPPRKPLGKRIAKVFISFIALGFAAALAVATIGSPLVVSSASATASLSHTKATSTVDGQHITAGAAKEAPIARGAFEALSADELYDLQTGDIGYTVNNSGPIRWPFNAAVALGDHFGERAAPCPGCSTFHNGTDFETGDAAPIYAVAAGTVTVSEYSGALGQHVAISHVVHGQAFTSIYGHMTPNSSTLQVGQVVPEGALVGLTGSTGESTGPHLFFEIDINGVPVDSFVWLKANTAH
jgi:murein DD-endopeptidase MepM/ murein hydrolase activator NlpD